jgi:hypothetical protein
MIAVLMEGVLLMVMLGHTLGLRASSNASLIGGGVEGVASLSALQ